MNSRLHKLTAATSVAILALGVTACGGDDKKAADPEKSATPSATPSSKGEGDKAPAASADDLARMQGLEDAQAEAGTVHVEVALGPKGQQTKAAGDLKFGKKADRPAISASLEMESNKAYSLSMILLDPALYLNLGQATGGKYGEVDLGDKKDKSVANQFTPLIELLNPATQLTTFKKALRSFEQKGEVQEIDGVKATPYNVVLSTSKIPGAEKPTKDTPKTASYTVYVGPDQLVRRVSFEGADGAFQTDYSKWGEPVTIKAPKSSQISPDALNALRGTP